MSKVIASTIISFGSFHYEVEVVEAKSTGEKGESGTWCKITLADSHFSSSLDWLEYAMCLEDGDAIHNIPFKTVIEIGKWARENGHKEEKRK